MNIFSKTFNGLRGLFSGMGLTLKYFLRFDKVITQQYPENRATLKMPSRFRGRLELVKDPESENYKCSACGICVKACPNNSIIIDKERDPVTKKMRLTKYEYHFDRCVLCGLCVESCKFGALHMSQQFETAVFSREELTQILNDDYKPAETKTLVEDSPKSVNPPSAENKPGAEDKPK